MKKVVLLAATAMILSGCSTIATTLAGVEDRARETSEWTICRGISVGAWSRSYGQDPTKADAWRVLCSDPITNLPIKPN